MKLENTDLTVNVNLGATGEREKYWNESGGTIEQKLCAFPKFVSRSELARFIVKHEIFQRVLTVQGSIVECGVFSGGGLFTWANLSAIFEPLNHRRRIIGFDTFEGFPHVAEIDKVGDAKQAVVGGLCGGSAEDLETAIALFDIDRPISSIPKVHLVAGDFMKTCQEFIDANPQLIVSLLYLDFDLYEPTKHALEHFLPLMPKGAIVAFDELHAGEWPGETRALADVVGIAATRLERLPFSSISWWQID